MSSTLSTWCRKQTKMILFMNLRKESWSKLLKHYWDHLVHQAFPSYAFETALAQLHSTNNKCNHLYRQWFFALISMWKEDVALDYSTEQWKVFDQTNNMLYLFLLLFFSKIMHWLDCFYNELWFHEENHGNIPFFLFQLFIFTCM